MSPFPRKPLFQSRHQKHNPAQITPFDKLRADFRVLSNNCATDQYRQVAIQCRYDVERCEY